MRIKADVKVFTETSLNVITADGQVYSFVVDYSRELSYLNINIGRITETDSTYNVLHKIEQVIYSEPATNKTVLSV